MRTWILTGVLILGMLGSVEAVLSPKAHKALQVLDDVDEEVNRALRDYGVPGIAVGIVVDGELIFAKGYGQRDLEQQLPVTPATIFPVGSCTKSFTAFMLGNLIDEGLLSWDQPVVETLPDFRLYNEYATLNVTVRDVISHRTGLARHPFMAYNSGMTKLEALKRLRFLEPACDLRERYYYNDLMFVVAEALIEQVTGKTWSEVLHERVLRPLGMKNTTCSIADMQLFTDVSAPYLEKNGKLKRISYRELSPLRPAGGLNSNVYDMAEWVKLHLNNGVYQGKTLMTRVTLQEMHSPQMVIAGVSEHPGSIINSCGLGWFIQSHRGHYNICHHGGLDGFTSFMSLLPREGVGVIVLGNRNLSMLPYILSLHFLDRALGIKSTVWIEEGLKQLAKEKASQGERTKKEGMQRKLGTNPLHPLEAYVGEYSHPGYGTMKIELINGALHATLHGLTMVLGHWHYDVFNIEEEVQDACYSRVGFKFSFHNDSLGDVGEVVVPFESSVADIVFKKRPNPTASSFDYLMQFVGPYDVEDVTVEIMLRGGALYAVIPGQPLYEMVPNGSNEFTVKKLAGLSVRFLLNEENQVEEVLLIAPYGAMSAKPKR